MSRGESGEATLDEEVLLRLIAVELGRQSVSVSDRLLEDLGAESMDLVGVLATVEEDHGVELDEVALAGIGTVGELVERILKEAGAAFGT